jgi:hypothetical protein
MIVTSTFHARAALVPSVAHKMGFFLHMHNTSLPQCSYAHPEW